MRGPKLYSMAWRNLWRHKFHAVLNILGLTVALTGGLLIFLYVYDEFSYDRFNEKFDRIYRLEFGNRVGQPTAPGHQIKQNFSEVENVVRLVNWQGKDEAMHLNYIPEGDSTEISTVKVEDYFWCDSSIFEVFSFDF